MTILPRGAAADQLHESFFKAHAGAYFIDRSGGESRPESMTATWSHRRWTRSITCGDSQPVPPEATKPERRMS